MKGDTLTLKQEAFCAAYMANGGNASDAYRKSYAAEKMKAETINRNACELLQDNKIAARIAALRQAAADIAVLEEAKVLREVARLALSDPGELFDDNGDLRSIKDMPASLRACIASVEIDNRTERDPDDPDKFRSYTVKKVKMWDKNSALEKAMKHLGSFEKDNKQRAGIFDDLPPEEAQAVRDFLNDISRAASARVKSSARTA